MLTIPVSGVGNTPVRVTATATKLNRGLLVIADPANTATGFVGNGIAITPGTDAASGIPVFPGAWTFVPLEALFTAGTGQSDAANAYVVCGSGANKFYFVPDGDPRLAPASPLSGGGTAGTPGGAVKSVQGVSGGTPVPVAGVSPTAPTFLSPTPIPAAYAADDSVTAVYTLDLMQRSGAWLYPAIGRQAATALTRSAYIAARPTRNGSATIRLAGTNYDQVSSTAAVGATTLNGATAAGDTAATLTSATMFAVGDWVCFSSPDTAGNRIEFARIRKIATNTLTFEQPLLIAHSNADRVTSAADLFGRVWLPGGDFYSIFGVNNSGQPVVFQLEAATVA